MNEHYQNILKSKRIDRRRVVVKAAVVTAAVDTRQLWAKLKLWWWKANRQWIIKGKNDFIQNRSAKNKKTTNFPLDDNYLTVHSVVSDRTVWQFQFQPKDKQLQQPPNKYKTNQHFKN